MLQLERRAAFRVVLGQGLVTLAIAALVAAIWGRQAAMSSAWGGGIGMFATAFMALAMFRYGEGAGAGRLVWGFYFGQFLKTALSIGLLLVAFQSQGMVPLALLGGYAGSFAGYWAAARWPSGRRR